MSQLDETEGESRLFVALAGAIVVASGAGFYLNLSPLLTTLVLGFILANSGSSHRDVTRMLLATERPVYLRSSCSPEPRGVRVPSISSSSRRYSS